MVEKDDAKARKARARRLRNQISRVIESTENRSEDECAGNDARTEEDEKRSESPREFIRRKMRELDGAPSKSKDKS